jgi:hypothetical protein
MKQTNENPRCDHMLPKKLIVKKLNLWLQFLGSLMCFHPLGITKCDCRPIIGGTLININHCKLTISPRSSSKIEYVGIVHNS